MLVIPGCLCSGFQVILRCWCPRVWEILGLLVIPESQGAGVLRGNLVIPCLILVILVRSWCGPSDPRGDSEEIPVALWADPGGDPEEIAEVS